ncbi:MULTISPECIES: hypothetical protein [Morganellaceae]|uniref:Uncharacterized protein n=4 Tax=Morganellaceae TaxID=1903414 RepID=A0A1B8HML5_9GAMM|nr:MULTISPECIES: hypothetical protein [Morganellaceae]OBU10597.1 hypothetical protein AYY17_15775 [Morganella psychrotolerans]UNH29101.1 hypothetical protein MNY64_16255 [Moellerella wisconsensis]UNH32629.1 hypothetical protein MNY72_16530 [Moellerella wisconsensis]UNH40682.1 hypothetical protein MNY70_17750 [Moellerella wisconsensis]UNH44386.1 hypothetical protein MNY66_16695 [Moellerella wisconsensis]
MNYSHLPMPTREAHYAFLKSHYLSARFEGRNNASWGEDYSRRIAESEYLELEKTGYTLISDHESASRQAVFYHRSLIGYASMSEMCDSACNAPEAICVQISVPAQLAPKISEKSLSELLAKLKRDIMGTFPLCRVELTSGSKELYIEVFQTEEMISKQIEGFVNTIVLRWSQGYYL